MPQQFEFVCNGCSGLTFLAETRFPERCPVGHQPNHFRRQWSFAVHRQWEGHYNPSVGRFVSNPREFSDALKAASDTASEELGMEHRFRPLDPRDRDATRVTAEGEGTREPVTIKAGGWEAPTHTPEG